ncbi:MAG: hypothetical protein AAB131_08930, partial [Actinomycetota bacterium]
GGLSMKSRSLHVVSLPLLVVAMVGVEVPLVPARNVPQVAAGEIAGPAAGPLGDPMLPSPAAVEVPPLEVSGSSELSALPVDPVLGSSPRAGAVEPEVGDGAALVASEMAAADAKRTVDGFDPGTSLEAVSARSEFTTVFANADGTSTAVISLEPQHYQVAPGRWAKIDPRLVPVVGEVGVFETAAGSVRVRADVSGLTVGTPRGRAFHLAPVGDGAKLSAPQVAIDGLSVTYGEVWPGVDVRFRVSNTTLTKEFVLTRPGTAGSFGVALDGLVLVDDGKGVLSVVPGRG